MIERRFTSKIEIRASAGDEGALIISGRAASFGTLSENLGNFRETIKCGAFTRSLQSDRDTKCLFNHSNDVILGRKRNSTLTLSEDSNGLNFRAILPPTQAAKDVFALVSKRYADSCSFAFEIDPGNDGDDPGEDWDQSCTDPDTGERMRLRTLKRVKLHDVSVLSASPAYPTGTSVEVNQHNTEDEDGDENDEDVDDDFYSLVRSASDYFPQGVPKSFPMEVRARLLKAQHNTGKEARRRLLNIILT